MIRKPISRKTDLTYMLISVAILLACYSFLSWRQHIANPHDRSIPNLSQFVEGWKQLLHPDEFGRVWLLDDSLATGSRLLAGMGVAVVLSVFLGVGMGVHPPLESLFRPPITFLFFVPATAMLAVYYTLFGTDFKMYVAMVGLGVSPSLSSSIFNAVRVDVEDHDIYKAYTLGASSFEVILEVVFKQIFPRVIDSIRLAIGPAMLLLIAAEWANASVGFGYRLRIESRFNLNIVYTYLIFLFLFGFLTDRFLIWVRKTLCPWF